MNVSDITASVNKRMDELETLRERSISVSRSVIRATKKAIHAIHGGNAHETILSNAISEFNALCDMISGEPEILFSGPVADAMTELAEACILSALVLGKEVPSYTSLNITPQSWAMGLADSLGELRRILLARLMDNRVAEAKKVFDVMETVCDCILSFDVPDAILLIRRKQDVARSVMERTRTDITNAVLMNNISKQ
jgi:translin